MVTFMILFDIHKFIGDRIISVLRIYIMKRSVDSPFFSNAPRTYIQAL